MKFELYTDAALACDVPEHRLRRGDLVKLVERHVAPPTPPNTRSALDCGSPLPLLDVPCASEQPCRAPAIPDFGL